MAQDAEFFSFGTNDLTQATFSFSREDAENKFLPAYNETGILQDNPFEVLDIKGVGQLMKMAVESGRQTRPDLKVGICGEHGGDPGLDPLLPPASASTTCPAPARACRSRAWRRRRPSCWKPNTRNRSERCVILRGHLSPAGAALFSGHPASAAACASATAAACRSVRSGFPESLSSRRTPDRVRSGWTRC